VIQKRYRYWFCGSLLNAWLPAAREPDGAFLLGHLAQHHSDQVTAYLDQMRTDDDHNRVKARHNILALCHFW
jgi:hypothetical protein